MAKESSGRSASGNDADNSIKSAQADLLNKKKKETPEQREAREAAEKLAAGEQAVSPESEHVEVAQAAGAAPAAGTTSSSTTTTTTTTPGADEGLSTGAYLALGGGAIGLAAIALGSGGGGGGGGGGNSAPVANDPSPLTTNEDTAVSGTVLASDADNDTLTYTVTTQPAGGSVNMNANGEFTFSPNANFSGPVTFNYVVTDTSGATDSGTVTINVVAVNDAPVVGTNAGVPAAEGGAVVNGTLSGSDVDSTALTFVISGATPPGFTLNAATGAYSFDPSNAAYNSLAAGAQDVRVINYTVSDGVAPPVAGSLTITVTGTNDAPVAQAGVNTVAEDGSVTGQLVATDPDIGGLALSFSVATQPPAAEGSVVIQPNGSYTFTPAANFNGTTSFTYQVSDNNPGGAGTSTATVTITVTSVNDAPIASAVAVNATEDGAVVSGNLGNFVADADHADATLSYALLTAAPAGFTLNTATGAYSFDPSSYDALGLGDSVVFSVLYTATDPSGATSNTSVINITITGVNDLPVVSAVTLVVPEDSIAVGNLVATDADEDDVLTFAFTGVLPVGLSLTNPATGAFSFNADSYDTLAAGATLDLVVGYTVNDGSGPVASTLTITITGTNDAPVVASLAAAAVNEDASITGTLGGSDVDVGNVLNFVITGAIPAGFTLTNAATGAFSFDASSYDSLAAGQPLTLTVNFTVSDGIVTVPGTRTIVITGVNDAPVATALSISVIEDDPNGVTATLPATDIDGDSLTYSVPSVGAGAPAKGVVTITDAATGQFTYVPNDNAVGSDSFTFTVLDGNGGSSTATVTVTITPADESLTTGQDSLVLDGSNDLIVGQNEQLNAGDLVDGGGGVDSLVLTFDDTSFNPSNVRDFAGFTVLNVERLEVDNSKVATGILGQTVAAQVGDLDGGTAEIQPAGTPGAGPLTETTDDQVRLDLSSSGFINVLASSNSSGSVVFNNAASSAGPTVTNPISGTTEGSTITNLEIERLTSGSADVVLDIRNDDVTGNFDRVNVLITALETGGVGNGNGVDVLAIDQNVEIIGITTGGNAPVVINILDTDRQSANAATPPGVAAFDGAHTLIIDTDIAPDLSDAVPPGGTGFPFPYSLVINAPLDTNVRNVDGTASTGGISLSAINAVAAALENNVEINTGSGADQLTGAAGLSNIINAGDAPTITLTGPEVLNFITAIPETVLGGVIGSTISFPATVTFTSDATLGAGSTLLVNTIIQAGTVLPAGTLLAAGSTLFNAGVQVVIPEGTILASGTTLPTGTVIPQGTILPSGFIIPAGSVIAPGSVINGVTYPNAHPATPGTSEVLQTVGGVANGVTLTGPITLTSATTLSAGSLLLGANASFTAATTLSDDTLIPTSFASGGGQRSFGFPVETLGNFTVGAAGANLAGGPVDVGAGFVLLVGSGLAPGSLLPGGTVLPQGSLLPAGSQLVLGNIVQGGNLADTITSGSGNASINAGTGDDSINAGLTGNSGAGDNTIATGAGLDTVNTGAGNDSINLTGVGNNIVNSGAGNDTVVLGSSNDNVSAGPGEDLIFADSMLLTSTDVLNGGANNDTLIVVQQSGGGFDLLNVQQIERVVLDPANTIVGGSFNYTNTNNNSTFDIDPTIVTIDGSNLAGAETLFFNGNGRNAGLVLIGAGNNDTLVGGESDDTLVGGLGNDSLLGGGVNTSGGNDTFVFRGGELTIADTVAAGNGVGTNPSTNDTILALKDNLNADGTGAINETFTLGGGISGVENFVVRNQAFRPGEFREDQFLNVTKDAGTVNVIFDASYNQANLSVDATDLDVDQPLILNAAANIAGENLSIRAGAGADSISLGGGIDSVLGGFGNDTVNMNAGLTAADTINGEFQVITPALIGNPEYVGGNVNDSNIEQIIGNHLRVNSGLGDGAFANVSNFSSLTIQTQGSTQLGTEADQAGFDLVNLNPDSNALPGGNDTLNAAAFSSGLIVNDYLGNDSIATGISGDTLNFGRGNDTYASGAGDDSFFVQGTELGNSALSLLAAVPVGDEFTNATFGDSINAGQGTAVTFSDGVQLDARFSAVNAAVDLNAVLSVENYNYSTFGYINGGAAFNGDRNNVVGAEIDNNSLIFNNGNVGTGALDSAININLTGLTDINDSFTVALLAGLIDSDYSFSILGSATDDVLIKYNTFTQNTISFIGGSGDDTLQMSGDVQGANITFDGDGLGAASNAFTDADLLNITAISGTGVVNDFSGIRGDVVRAWGDTSGAATNVFVDNDFTSFTNVEILEDLRNDGFALRATLGQRAATAGINIVVGGDSDDLVIFDPGYNRDVLIDISAGGNDTINVGAFDTFFGGPANNVVTFLGSGTSFTAGDLLTAGTGSNDRVVVRNDGGTANLTTTTNVEFITVADVNAASNANGVGNSGAGDQGLGFGNVGNLTVVVDTTNNDLNNTPRLQTIDASQMDANEIFTLVGGTATANLSVLGGSGNDFMQSGSGNDTINGGAGSGNDQINGGLGGDSLVGGDGNDTIVTGASNASMGDNAADTVNAGNGADFIISGTGGDLISVGAGNSTFLGDGSADSVSFAPASPAALVNGVPTINDFGGNDTVQLSLAFFVDGAQTLLQDATGVDQARGDSWFNPNAGANNDSTPELVAVSGVAANAGTAVGVAEFLILQDLAEGNNGQAAIFAVSDGTNTYLWHYRDDQGGGNISATDFTLIARINGITVGPGANQFSGDNMRLSYGFTNFDDNVLVVDGSTVDGLDGNDDITLIDNGGPTTGAFVQVSNIEIVRGTAGSDSVTFVDPDLMPQTVEFFGGGNVNTDTVNLSNGQTLIAHSNLVVTVGGGNATNDQIDNNNGTNDPANGTTVDNTPETVILADGVGDAPHTLVLAANTTPTENAGGVESVNGSTGNDNITWQVNVNATVIGDGGLDTVTGANGGQQITLTDIDSTSAGTGNDSLFSNGANGIIDGNGGLDTVQGLAGDDSVASLVDIESANGNAGNDTFNASNNGQAIHIAGGAGNDSLTASAFGDTLVGGLGNDTLVGLTGSDSVSVNVVTDGADSVNLDGNDPGMFDVVNVTGAGQVRLSFISGEVGNASANDGGAAATNPALAYGGAGDLGLAVRFELENGAGAVTGEVGATPNPLSRYDDEGTTFTAGPGLTFDVRDLVGGFQRGDFFTTVSLGTAGNDNVVGTAGADYINLGMGDDVAAGLGGNDFLVGGAGDDSLDGGSENDTLLGGGGNDTLLGGLGNDSLLSGGGTLGESANGGGGSDTLLGSAGGDSVTFTQIDSIVADAGNDSFTIAPGGNAEALTINGGLGSDTLVGSTSGDQVNITDVESVSTLDAADSISINDANSVAVTIDGGAIGGADSVFGSVNADTLTLANIESLVAGNGDDSITVTDSTGLGASLGLGNDIISFTSATGGRGIILGDGGSDSVQGSNASGPGSGDSLTVTTVESVSARAGDDSVTVTDSTGITIGLGEGLDVLTFIGAGGANATIDGDAGIDSITGTNANDTLSVAAGDNISTLGGNDSVTITDSTAVSVNLGAGADSLLFTASANATVEGGSSGADVDIVIGSGVSDVLSLANVEVVTTNAGDDSIVINDGNMVAVSINGGAGLDSVFGSTNGDVLTVALVETVTTGVGNDSVSINDANGQQAVSVNGGVGNDSLFGNSDNDVLTVALVETVTTGVGNDSVSINDANGQQAVSVNGGVGNDSLFGNSDNDVLTVALVETVTTGVGNDSVSINDANGQQAVSVNGGVGNDSLFGNSDNDVLTVALVETVTTGVGNDSVSINDANGQQAVSVNGGVGNDSLFGNSDNDVLTVALVETVTTGVGNDSVSINDANGQQAVSVNGGVGNDSLFGNSDNDVLTVALVETVTTGVGNDSVSINDANGQQAVSVNGGVGNDSLFGNSDNDVLTVALVETVTTGVGNDSVSINDANGQQAVSVNGGVGNDSLFGNSDNDVLTVALVETVTTGVGNDSVSINDANGQQAVSVNGGVGNDSLFGNSDNDVLTVALVETVTTGVGNDSVSINDANGQQAVSVNGGVGNDSLFGNSDNDVLTVALVETVTTGVGNDSVSINDANGQQAVSVNGGVGNDSLFGNSDNDVLTVALVETVTTGVGNDSVSINDANGQQAVSVNGGVGNDSLFGNSDNDVLTVALVETVTTGVGNDSVSINDANGQQAVSVNGGVGNDSLFGNSDNDVLTVALVETVTTGVGNDTVSINDANGTQAVSVNGGAGSDSLIGSTNGDVLTVLNVDSVTSGLGADSILIALGNTDSVSINGGDGTDSVFGSENADSINLLNVEFATTNGGADAIVINDLNVIPVTVNGGADADSVFGGTGNDSLVITMVETVTTNAGNDTVLANDGAVGSANLGLGNDRITFTQAIGGITVDGEGDGVGAGLDSVFSSDNADSVNLLFVDQIDVAGGNDTVISNADLDSAVLGGGNDSLLINGNNVLTFIDGGNDNDSVNANGNMITLDLTLVEAATTGAMNDSVAVSEISPAGITLNVGAGNDSIDLQDEGSATITGGAGSDLLGASGSGANVVRYTGGADTSVDSIALEGGNDAVTITDATAIVADLGSDDDSIIFETTANATIQGNSDDDTVSALSGGDDIFRVTNVESLASGAGSDNITVVSGAITINADAGGDTITFLGSVGSVNGGTGIDSLQGAPTMDSLQIRDVETINTFGGDDQITVHAATDGSTLNAGENNDTVVYLAALTGMNSIQGGLGMDSLVLNGGGMASIGGFENLQGSNMNDNFTLEGDVVSISMLAGNDTVTFNSAAINATVDGGTHVDGTGGDSVFGSAGDDSITLINVEGAQGNAGNDTFNADAALITSNMGLGNDLLSFAGATAGATGTHFGGTGSDTFVGSAFGDLVTLGDSGGASNQFVSVNAGAGNDVINEGENGGNAGTLDLGTGDDSLRLSSNQASIVGGDGSDSILLTGGGAGTSTTVTFDGGANDDVLTGSADDDSVSVISVESVDGGLGSDTIVGSAGGDSLTVIGVESLSLLGGNDAVTSNDTGGTSMLLGAGDDSVVFGGASANAVIDGGTENDQVTSTAGADTLLVSNVESVNSGDGNDGVTTNSLAAMQVSLGGGDDTFDILSNLTDGIVGPGGVVTVDGGGNTTTGDTVIGSTGDDSINVSNVESVASAQGNDTVTASGAQAVNIDGSVGDDSLTGGTGADTLNGGTDQDTMTSGGGIDTFLFAFGDSGTPSDINFDRITDLASAVDAIDFAVALTKAVQAGAAAAGLAMIDANGVAVFDAADDTTAERIIASHAAAAAGGDNAGEAVLFQGGAGSGDAANAYIFVSDGVAGIGTGDVLIQLANVDTTNLLFNELLITAGNATVV